MATFITSKSVGQTINVYLNTSTGYWKYNHDGNDSIPKQGYVSGIEVTNANGEFTLISCDSQGNISGNVIGLDLRNNHITSFDGTNLSTLIYAYLSDNQITSFDGTDLTSLTDLYLINNQLTSLSGFILPTSLNYLYLTSNQLISVDVSSLINLTNLFLNNNQLTSFDGTDLTSLHWLDLENNNLTSLNNFIFPSSLHLLFLGANQLTTFDTTGLSSLTQLNLYGNQFTSFDTTGLSNLHQLVLSSNQLTSLDVTGLSNLNDLRLDGNPLTPSANNQILQQLNQNGMQYGYFPSSNGRTSESNSSYNNLLNNLGWTFSGLDLQIVGNGRLAIRGVISTPSWNGGVIYNIGAVVTHEGQTWHCIQYAPAGYGPFGGYIDVYWSLGGTPPQVTHDELNANINGPSVLFRTHDFSMTMVQDGGKNDGKYSIHLDGKPFKSAMLQLNVGTPSAPCNSQYNDIVVAAIVFNSASTALAFKSNNNWPNGNVINFDNSPDINNEINEWGYFEGFQIAGINGNPADINSCPDDAKMGELFGNNAVLANSGYGPSDLDKIIIVICERDRATSQTVQYFEKWFAFELVGPEVYPNGWV